MHVCSYIRFVHDGGYASTHFVPLPIHPYLLWKRRYRRASYCLLESSEVLHSASDIDSTNPSANSSQTLSSFFTLLPTVRSSSIHLCSLCPSSFPPYKFASIFADVTMSESTEPLFASLASNTTCVRSVRTVVASVSLTCSSSFVPLLSKSSATYASYSINRRERHPMAVSLWDEKRRVR